MGNVACLWARISESDTSNIERANAKMPPAKRCGASSGKVTRANARSGPAPRLRAASSSATSICWSPAAAPRTTNGRRRTAVRRLPFVVRGAAAGLQQIDVALEEAARNLGAGPLRAFARVTLPLLAPHLLAGGIFAFALSMLEVSDSLILAQRQATFPITKAIYELFQLLGDGRSVAAALGVWVMVFLGISVAVARSLVGRRWGGMFRL